MQRSRSSIQVAVQSPTGPAPFHQDDAAAKDMTASLSKVVKAYALRAFWGGLWLQQRLQQALQRGSALYLVLALTLLVGIGLLTWAARHTALGRSGQGLRAARYAVYIDGGSSGTRVHVFEYRMARWPAYVRLRLPEPSTAVEPGLSAYALDPGKAAQSLDSLIEFAYQQVPRHAWHTTPIQLLATAGLRLLLPEQASAILAACQAKLASSSFMFQQDWARVIDGTSEGLYGWAAVNYVTGALQEAAEHHRHSRKEMLEHVALFRGILEMGGASMQITFLPSAQSVLPDDYGAHLHLPGVPSALYSHSYLGMGMDAALARAVELVRARQWPYTGPRAHGDRRARGADTTSRPMEDPCLPIGYISDDGRHGNASFAACWEVTESLVPPLNCSEAPAVTRSGHATGPKCTLGGSYLPPLTGSFIAMENFAWTAKALGLPQRATLRQLKQSAIRYCSRHWSSLHAEFSGHIPDQFLTRYCFGSAFILRLLHQGFGIGMDEQRLVWSNTIEDTRGKAVGLNWVLGRAVVDVMGAADARGRGTLGFMQQVDEVPGVAAGHNVAIVLPLISLVLVSGVFLFLRVRRGAAWVGYGASAAPGSYGAAGRPGLAKGFASGTAAAGEGGAAPWMPQGPGSGSGGSAAPVAAAAGLSASRSFTSLLIPLLEVGSRAGTRTPSPSHVASVRDRST